MTQDGFALGTMLGALQQGQERLIYLAELHGRLLAQMTETQAQTARVQASMAASLAQIEARPPTCPHPTPPKTEKLELRDRVQLWVMGLALVAAVAGKLPWKDFMPFLKPFGF